MSWGGKAQALFTPIDASDSKESRVFYTVARVMKELFGMAPGASAASLLSIAVEGLFPAIQTVLLTGLFDGAGAYMAGDDAVLNRVVMFAAAFVGCFAVKQIVSVVSSVACDAGIYERSRFFGRMRVAEKAARLSLDSYEDAAMLDVRERADACVDTYVFGDIFISSLRILTSALGLVSLTLVLAGYDVLFVVISIVSVLPNLIMRAVRGKKFYLTMARHAKKNRRLDYLWRLLTRREGMKELRVTGCDEYLSKCWRDVRDHVLEEKWDMQRHDAYALIWCDVLKVAGYGASLALACILVTHGSITVGLFGACISAFLSLQNQMKGLLIGLGNMGEKAGYAHDYFAFLDRPEEEDGKTVYKGMRGVGFEDSCQSADTLSISAEDGMYIDDVTFSYPGADSCALDRVVLHIKPGEKIAIVGENGSGKTTLAKLILGLYTPASGTVRYGGRAVQDFERASFMRTVSVITQDFMVYKLNLRENVALSDIDRMGEDDAICSVLEAVGLADLLGRCGLDDAVGREFGGIEFSGGQGQRLAIARCMFRESDLVVLDEPTSALDPLIEAEVLSRFLDIVQDKTAVIVSHRVGLCRLVDRVAVMHDGHVVEMGSHDELLSIDGEYARLFKAQEQWYLPR